MTLLPPRVGIVTINYNGKGYLVDYIRSLRAVRYPNYELFLLDNASTDGSPDELLSVYPDVPIVRLSQNMGVAAGNNLGIKYFREQGKADYILFLNPDTVHKPEFLDALVKYANGRTMVAPRAYFFDTPSILNTTVGDFNWWRGVMAAPYYNHPDSLQSCQVQEVEVAATYALLVPVGVFAEVGVMDEAYFLYCDDPDFVLRARQVGYRIVYNPHSIIYHREKASTGGQGYSAIGLYYFYRNRPYMMRKLTRGEYRFFLFMLAYLIEWGMQCIRFSLMRRWDWVKALTEALKDFQCGRMGQGVLR